ncbi:MAG: hypothetical protein Q7S52_04040 [bacterium]|nr:hypothetical protein [bacterium]
MPKRLAEVVLPASFSDDMPKLSVGGYRWEVWTDLPSDEFRFERVEASGGDRTLCATKRAGTGAPSSERIHIWVMPETAQIWQDQNVVLLVMADTTPGSINYIVVRAIPAEDRVLAIKRAQALNARIIDCASKANFKKRPQRRSPFTA